VSDAADKPDATPGSPTPRLVCPQCKALYQPARPTFGRRVRCRHCGHVWRDESRAAGQVAGALGVAAANWGQVGPATLAAADHGSTVGRVVAGLGKVVAPPAGDWVGKTLGRYEVKNVLGQGAMGYVYEALDRDLKRMVALKFLPRTYEPGQEPVGVRMFIQEARVAAKLVHPNIVTIFEIGQQDGYYFFAMERVHGVTLAMLIEQSGPLPAAQTCYVIAQAARALGAAHQAGIVHRDVKPSNILIDERGQVKVADFGLADVEGIEGVAEARNRPMGTPGWMAPEVARGERAAPTSDIYSLGLVIYAAMAGRKLIQGTTKSGMVLQHREAKSFRRDDLPPAWPPRLADITIQCLQVDPMDRYQSAEMLAVDLARALAPDHRDDTLNLESGPQPARTVAAVSPTISWVVLAALGVVVVLIAIWFWFLRR